VGESDSTTLAGDTNPAPVVLIIAGAPLLSKTSIPFGG
jgi:hypothetical protein